MLDHGKKHEEHCRSLGNIIVCLHYLAGEARKSDLKEVAEHLDQVIIRVARMGREAYMSYLDHPTNDDKSVQAFVETFCPVADESMRFGLRELIHSSAPKSEGEWPQVRAQK